MESRSCKTGLTPSRKCLSLSRGVSPRRESRREEQQIHPQKIRIDNQGVKSSRSPNESTNLGNNNGLGKYRIPKKGKMEADKEVDNSKAHNLTSSNNDISGMKSPINKLVHSAISSVKKEETITTVVLPKTSKAQTPSSEKAKVDIVPKIRVRNLPLKAKRRLPSSAKCDKKTSGQVIKELPDYEDSIQEEGKDYNAELDNRIPQILKMIKTDSQPLTTPSNRTDDICDMDVDLPEAAISSQKEVIVIVPDTNIWINALNLIQNFVKDEFMKPLKIIIPWMVLQELDVGVHQRRNQLQAEMRKPIKYIHSLLSMKHPRVIGQRAAEAAISKLKFDEMVADDSILGCALQNQKLNNVVIFVSNDKNLLNKAIVNGITAVDSSNAMKTVKECDTLIGPRPSSSSLSPSIGLPPLIPSENSPLTPVQSVALKRRFDINRNSFGTEESKYIVVEDVEMLEESETPRCKIKAVGQPFSSAKPLKDGFKVLEKALLKVFSYIIRRKMIEDYGMGGWEYALKVKPPWTLESAIKTMLVHWIANFSYVFNRRGQTHLENLKSIIHQGKYKSVKTEDQIVESALSLLNFLEKDFENEEPINECKRELLDFSKLHKINGAC